jgi:hypothetical protein
VQVRGVHTHQTSHGIDREESQRDERGETRAVVQKAMSPA